MSQFKVLVVGPDNYRALCNVLEPYSEFIKFPPYIKFTREDKAAERKKLLKYWTKQLKLRPMDLGIENKIVALGFDDDDYFLKQTQYYDKSALNDYGEPISTYNPNTKWSGWDYTNDLPQRHGQVVQACRKRDVDWNYVRQIGERNAWINWPKIVNSKSTDFTKNMLYDFWQGETKEQYIKRQQLFLTHAFILHGKWHERGKIGWWSDLDSSDTSDRQVWLDKYAKMLRQVKPNTVLTTVECRI
jgi:hypothetical protein